jgi:NAD(P)H-flavin reductase/hemoglobin-like flavoprotein
MTAGGQDVAGTFYSRLFTKHPELRAMFPAAMTSQNERLFRALMKIVALLDEPDRLARYLNQLGFDHRKYGVRPEHYAAVADALLYTLRRHCAVWGGEEEAAWTAAYKIAADAMIDGAGGHFTPVAWTGRVVRHKLPVHNVAVLTVRTSEPLPRMAGQYVTVNHRRWQGVWRPFSIANPPDGDQNLIELHVRAIGGGWVSTALVKDTGPDDEITIGPPLGTMTPEAIQGPGDLVCVAGGTGIAPLKAIITQVLGDDEAAGPSRNITLFYGARTPQGLYDMPALRRLSYTYPWLEVRPAVSDDPRFDGPQGNIADIALNRGRWADRDAFIAGPLPMVTSAVCGFRDTGLPAGRVHFDDIEARHDL